MKMGVAKPEGSVSNREREDSLKVMKQETAAQRFRSTPPVSGRRPDETFHIQQHPQAGVGHEHGDG